MKKKLFVVLSHDLTAEQIADFDGEIILLKTISSEVANECANIDPNTDIQSIQKLAAQVVVLAYLAEATHFCCQGEPGLQMWTNLIANGNVLFDLHQNGNISIDCCEYHQGYIQFPEMDPIYPQMICITSTTQRQSIDELQPDRSVVKKTIFKHVKWRELF